MQTLDTTKQEPAPEACSRLPQPGWGETCDGCRGLRHCDFCPHVVAEVERQLAAEPCR
jgi:hypothetical protein